MQAQKKSILSSLAIILFFFLSAAQAHAQIIINEFLPQPSSGPEWVELYNASSQTINLNNWTLWDQLSSLSIIYSFNDLSLNPYDFLVVELTAAKLNNSGDSLILKNHQSEIIDEAEYSSSQADLSWAKIPDLYGPFELSQPSPGQLNLQFASPSPTPNSSPTPSGSPSPSPTSSPSPSPTSSLPNAPTTAIILSEVMACPDSGKEWVELKNTHDQAYYLDNWRLRDASGQTRTINSEISAQGFVVIEWSNKLLNNSGDSIGLETADKTIVDQMNYQSCQTNKSWIFDGQDWLITSTPTKNSTNLFKQSEANQDDEEESAVDQTDESSDKQNSNQASPSATQQPTTPSQKNLSFPFQELPTNLSLTSAKSHSFTKQSAPLELLAITPSRSNFISVILGGLILFGVGGYQLYQQHDQLKINKIN